jgi:hypothetical protein
VEDRNNGSRLVAYAGDRMSWRMRALLGRTIWDQERARHISREYVIERLGNASGVLDADETGFLKNGTHSVGVVRQYRVEWPGGSRTVGWLFLGYASAKGHARIDRRLFCVCRRNGLQRSALKGAFTVRGFSTMRFTAATRRYVSCWRNAASPKF